MKNQDMTDIKSDDSPVEGREEGFLSRWSRKKQEAQHEPAAEADDPAADIANAADGPPAGLESVESPAERELTDEDMPPLEDLDENSDVSPFLSAGVSEALRRAALRKLFRSAKFNVCDGLDDYAEDYTKFAPLGNTITADMKYHMERALEKLRAEESESAPETEGQEAIRAGSDDEQVPEARDRVASTEKTEAESRPETQDDPKHA